jgi:hypothetical protein
VPETKVLIEIPVSSEMGTNTELSEHKPIPLVKVSAISNCLHLRL